MSVLVIGGANLDILARSDAPLITATSNPGSTTRTPGGVARNIAENLARLGTDTQLVVALGSDPAGDLVLAQTQSAGVETIEVAWSGATSTYTAILDSDGSLVAGIADMAAVNAISPEQLDRDLLCSAQWLVLDGNLRADTLHAALTYAAEGDVPVVLDPVSAPKAAKLRALVGVGVHTITPTRDELAALGGEGLLSNPGVGVVWLRRGSAGSTLLRRQHSPVDVRLRRVDPVDVTGAGDAALAGYVHALAHGADLEEAAAYGSATALLTVLSPHSVRPDLSAAKVRSALTEHTLTEDTSTEHTSIEHTDHPQHDPIREELR